MRHFMCGLFITLAIAAAACSPSGTTGSNAIPQSNQRVRPHTTGANVVADPGFESGGFAGGWQSCGSVAAHVTTAKAHSGTHSALSGTTAKPEINGTAGVCQTITVPPGGRLSVWLYEGTNDSLQYVDQEGDVLSASGSTLRTLFKEATSTNAWVQRTYDLSAYAGQTVKLYFGVKANGYGSDYVYQYVDDVSLTGASSSPTPSPKPTATPSASPSASPTASPSSSPYPCNDPQFLTYQSEFAAGKISADQFVDVCGSVTQVLPAKKTTSGNHGYFYVQIPNGGTIEIVSNLDAMAQASSNRPPSTWPWVSVGQYVYVQGRYYYDNSSSQGIDWTEDDTSGSWPHVGWVVVCSSAGANCSKYW